MSDEFNGHDGNGYQPKAYKNPVCKGSWALGSACGTCERCADTKLFDNYNMPHMPPVKPSKKPSEYQLTREDKFALFFVKTLADKVPTEALVSHAAREAKELIRLLTSDKD